MSINLKEQVNQIKGGGTTIPAGIHTNVSITGVERGSNFVDILLTDSFGRTKKDRIFDPDDKYVYPKEGETKEDAYQRSVSDKSKLLLQYVVSSTDAELPDNVSGYEDVVKLSVNALQSASYPINLKLVQHKDEPSWSEFPRFAPYAERYRSDLPPTLKYSTYELKAMKPKENKPATDDSFTLF